MRSPTNYYIFLRLMAIVFFCILSVSLFAQPGDPGGGQEPDIPIQGLAWLLIAGAALGIKKIWDKHKGR